MRGYKLEKITFSYSVQLVRQMENVLTYNLAKSALYIHCGTFREGPLYAGVHKSALSLNTANEEQSE